MIVKSIFIEEINRKIVFALQFNTFISIVRREKHILHDQTAWNSHWRYKYCWLCSILV